MFKLENDSYLLLENGDNLLEESPQVYSSQMDTVSFSFSGISSIVSKQWKVAANVSSYILSVFDSFFLRTYSLITSVGNVSLNGISVILSRGMILALDSASFVFSGISVILKNFKISLEKAIISVSTFPISMYDKMGIWLKGKTVETSYDDRNTVDTIWDERGNIGFNLLLENGSKILLENGKKLHTEESTEYETLGEVSTIWSERPNVTTIWT